MTRIKKFALAALVALALVGGAVASAPAQQFADYIDKASPKLLGAQEGEAVARNRPTFYDITELEQVAGKDPEFPATSN